MRTIGNVNPTCSVCCAADNGVEGLCDILQPGECHAQTRPILIVGQRACHSVEVETDRSRNTLERLHIIKKNYGHLIERERLFCNLRQNQFQALFRLNTCSGGRSP